MLQLKDTLSSYITRIAILAILVMAVVSYLVLLPVNVSGLELNIPQGAGLNQIAKILKDNDAIRSKTAFVSYVRLLGESNNLKAGNYKFEGRVNVPDIVTILAEGKMLSDDISVLIPEGSNIWEVDNILSEKGFIGAGEFARQFKSKEGYLFPDTYRFPKPEKEKITPQAIGQKFQNNFNVKTDPLLGRFNDEKSRQIIIIASMLEKEAKTEEDMKIVAGIIQKRIELGMLLQIDAAVTYGACLREFQISTSRNCDVTRIGVANELKIDGPYNTYARPGLPAGPISNPGLKAIRSAISPTASDYLFYLSTRDGSKLIFSKTAAEHEANRKKYLGL